MCLCVCLQALLSERSCSSQLAQLSRSLQQKEEELRQVQDQHSSSYSDLEKIRELCVKLDASKEAVSLAGGTQDCGCGVCVCVCRCDGGACVLRCSGSWRLAARRWRPSVSSWPASGSA